MAQPLRPPAMPPICRRIFVWCTRPSGECWQSSSWGRRPSFRDCSCAGPSPAAWALGVLLPNQSRSAGCPVPLPCSTCTCPFKQSQHAPLIFFLFLFNLYPIMGLKLMTPRSRHMLYSLSQPGAPTRSCLQLCPQHTGSFLRIRIKTFIPGFLFPASW